MDFADLYLQHGRTLSLEDGVVKDAGYNVDRGFGLRVAGEQVGFAYAIR